MEDTYKGQVDNPLSMNRYTYTHNNPIRYVDPSGNQVSESGGWEPGGSYFYYDHDGVRRIHGSKEIDWNYYREWFVSDQAGMQETLRGTNKVKNHIAAKVTWDWAMENGVPMDGGGVGKVPGVTKGKSTTFKSLFGCNCFTAGTKVLTDEGEKPIEEIEVGDKVLAKDDETGEMAYKEVEWLFQRDVEETYNITVGGEVITTTDEHPFWIVGKGWVKSKDLVVGEVLTTSDGKEFAIEEIEVKKENKTVYNFKVKDFHTYFVSNLGIWTHNQCNDKKLSSPNPIPQSIRKQYEEIILGKGTPRVDPKTGKQTIFEGRENQGKGWIGSLEFDVPGTNHRILKRPDGKLGYVLNHDYKKPRLFPGLWYPDGGKK
ncbi:polymorphic toxin-type HINT domain-containing protein [Brevibacillus sp. FIR094]|uniref:polymorphic toxin-type HINT domain-containing protein n=1 Tax=Brevibacillus sp. FIR094 TaxID=3134809 RepID=UPI003D214383